MTREEAKRVLEIHLEHWQRLTKEKICTEQEGAETISALHMAIKALEQDTIRDEKDILKLLEKTYADFIYSEGGEGWLRIDGKEYSTDVGYAIEGLDIFMEVFKRRLVEED